MTTRSRVQDLVNVLQLQGGNESQEVAARALWSLAGQNEETKKAVAPAIEPLSKLAIQAANSDLLVGLCEACLGALWVISQLPANRSMVIVQPKLLETIAKVLVNGGSHRAKEVATYLLSEISKDPVVANEFSKFPEIATALLKMQVNGGAIKYAFVYEGLRGAAAAGLRVLCVCESTAMQILAAATKLNYWETLIKGIALMPRRMTGIFFALSFHYGSLETLRKTSLLLALEQWAEKEEDAASSFHATVIRLNLLGESEEQRVAADLVALKAVTQGLWLRSRGEAFVPGVDMFPWQMSFTLYLMSTTESNKPFLVEIGVIQLLKRILEKQSHEPVCMKYTVLTLLHLSFIPDGRALLATEIPTLKETLLDLHDAWPLADHPDLVSGCCCLIWSLENYHPLSPQQLAEASSQWSEERQQGHVMFSYHPCSEEAVVTIRDQLSTAGFHTWLDVGPTKQAQANANTESLNNMSQAVLDASLLIVALSAEMEKSLSLRLELYFAVHQKKRMIFVHPHDRYKPSGWLATLVENQTIFRMRNPAETTLEMASLIRELDARVHATNRFCTTCGLSMEPQRKPLEDKDGLENADVGTKREYTLPHTYEDMVQVAGKLWVEAQFRLLEQKMEEKMQLRIADVLQKFQQQYTSLEQSNQREMEALQSEKDKLIKETDQLRTENEKLIKTNAQFQKELIKVAKPNMAMMGGGMNQFSGGPMFPPQPPSQQQPSTSRPQPFAAAAASSSAGPPPQVLPPFQQERIKNATSSACAVM